MTLHGFSARERRLTCVLRYNPQNRTEPSVPVPLPRGFAVPRLLSLLALSALAICACSDDVIPSTAPPCVDQDADCGSSCDDDSACPDGLYCAASGTCGKECVSGIAAYACADLSACLSDGRCAGSLTDAGTDGGGLGQIDWDAGGDGDGLCADQTVTARQITPNVLLIIDQSGSMNDEFEPMTSRWNVLRDFLLGNPGGLIADLQSQVRFGLALYSAHNQSEPGGNGDQDAPLGECPLVEMVAPAIDNYQTIADTYSMAEPIMDTPTGDSIDKIIDDLGLDQVRPDMQEDPYVFILATDGNPDRCEKLQGHDAVSEQETIDAVTRAYGLGVRTFIISVGEGQISMRHQQDVANAGLGRGQGDPDAEFWVAGDDQSLRTALTDIVHGQLSCEVTLNGAVPGDGCDGTVRLNNEVLGCNDANGWKLVDPTHIRLQGAACDDLKKDAGVLLQVSFPCGVDIVF